VHYYEHGRIGPYVVDQPMVIGHEAAGVIVATGADVRDRSIGDQVALEPGVPCRRCEQCLAGRYNLCPDVVFFATPPVDGAISQLVAIDASFAHPVPDGLSYEQAAMAEPVSVGVWAARKAGRVVLVGMGADTVSIDVPLLQGREITLTGTFRYANTYPLALRLIAAGLVQVDEVITHRFGIDQTEDALTIGRRDPNALKAIVLPQQND
jgi:L-iditol 2-dehydrogenase